MSIGGRFMAVISPKPISGFGQVPTLGAAPLGPLVEPNSQYQRVVSVKPEIDLDRILGDYVRPIAAENCRVSA